MKPPIPIFGTIFIKKKNPWFNRRLMSALKKIGKVPKHDYYILASPPPWYGKQYWRMSDKQLERLRKFSEVSSKTGGMKIEDRLQILSKELATGRAPRKSKAKPQGERFHEKYATILEQVRKQREEMKAIAVTPPAGLRAE
jgi:hypothetical protein